MVEQPLPKAGRDQRGGGRERASKRPPPRAAPVVRSEGAAPGARLRGGRGCSRRERTPEPSDAELGWRGKRQASERARAGASFGAAARRSGGERRCGAVGGSCARPDGAR